jgi:hypothetical protein
LVPNKSYDLRLLASIRSHEFVYRYASTPVLQLFHKLVYGVGLSSSKSTHGTKELEDSVSGAHINTVSDLEKNLRAIILQRTEMLINNAVASTKMGDLYIYTDGRQMRFV